MRTMAGVTVFFLLAAALTGCGGRMVGKKTARNVIVGAVPDGLQPEDVEVDSVTQAGSRDAVVEARIRAAFRLENEKGHWVVREVRLGERQWERLDLILQGLETAKAEETRRILDEVASGLEAYARKNSGLPGFKDFVSLSDALHPGFLPRVIRLDAWQRPLGAERVNPNTIRLRSAGPDGKFGTPDDITRIYEQR